MSTIGVKLTGENVEFRRMLDQSVTAAAAAGGKIGDGVTGKLGNMKSVGTAVATALGLNLQNIAENVARVFTGMSKAEEDAYKRSEQLSDSLAALVEKNGRARLNEEQRYQLVLIERDRLQKQISETTVRTGQDQAALLEKQIKLEEAIAKIKEHDDKQRAEAQKKHEEFIKQRIAANEKEYEASLASLTASEKIASLKEAIAAQEGIIARGMGDQAALAAQNEVLAKRRVDLAQAEAAQKKEIAAIEKKNLDALAASDARQIDAENEKLTIYERRAGIVAEIAALDLEIDLLLGHELDATKQIARVDQLRGELRQIEKTEKEDIAELAALLLKDTASLTDAERTRLAYLQAQGVQAKLNAEIALLTAKVLDGSITPAEKERLGVLVQQAQVIKEQLSDLKEVNQLLTTITQKRGRADKDLSDRELDEKIRNLRKFVSDFDSDPSNARNNYGFMIAQQRRDLEFAEDERAVRFVFRSQYRATGERALNNYSAFDEQRYLNYVRPEDEARAVRTSDAIVDIQQRLSGTKPLFGG